MLRIDLHTGKALYEQIIEGVKAEILSGVLREGEALPSIRQMALELRVNPNTVARAYQELERQGVVTTAQGRGVFVSGEKPGYSPQEMAAWKKQLVRLITEMRFRGVKENEINALLDGLKANTEVDENDA